MANIKDETLALAALFQSCTQIQRVARSGYVDQHAAAAVLRGIIVTNPQTCEDIYHPSKLLVGFRQIVSSLGGNGAEKSAQTLEITKTAFKLISLELAIEKNAEIFNRLGSQIDEVRSQVLILHPEYENADPSVVMDQACIKMFADLYSSIISPNFPKLIIFGEEEYLQRIDNQELIRALLLAAIRAIVLWRQVGGRRRFFIFRRKAIIEYARQGASSNGIN